jgi:hypothetical protein
MAIAFAMAGIIGAVLSCLVAWMFRDHTIALDRNAERKIPELIPLIRKTSGPLLFASDFEPAFYNNPDVVEAIEAAMKRGVEVRIVSEADAPPWYQEQEESGRMEITRVTRLPYHMMVLGTTVRVETPHHDRPFGRDPKDVGLIIKDMPETAATYHQVFDAWIKAS